MSDRHFIYFAYGSNMSIGKLRRVAPSAVLHCIGWISGYRLACDKISKDGSGKFDCEHTGGVDDRVWGVVFKVADADRANLKKSEPRYHEKFLPVFTNDGFTDAVTYIAKADAKDPALKPYHWYRMHALYGAVTVGLPSEYIQSIRAIKSIPDSDIVRSKYEEDSRVKADAAISSRPVWNRADTYPANPNCWEYGRWAWEFLRRNPDFQQACDEAIDASVEDQLAVARSFGLAEYRHYRTSYPVLWRSEAFSQYEAAISASRDVNLRIEPGNVALVFDLNDVFSAGRAALKAKLWSAEWILEEYLADMEKARNQKSRSPKPRKPKLLTYLMVYDGVIHAKEDRQAVAKVIYGDHSADPGSLQVKAYKAIYEDVEAASEMVQRGYLELPPIDYLQKRSKSVILPKISRK